MVFERITDISGTCISNLLLMGRKTGDVVMLGSAVVLFGELIRVQCSLLGRPGKLVLTCAKDSGRLQLAFLAIFGRGLTTAFSTRVITAKVLDSEGVSGKDLRTERGQKEEDLKMKTRMRTEILSLKAYCIDCSVASNETAK